jgi:hypothetical protein
VLLVPFETKSAWWWYSKGGNSGAHLGEEQETPCQTVNLLNILSGSFRLLECEHQLLLSKEKTFSSMLVVSYVQ